MAQLNHSTTFAASGTVSSFTVTVPAVATNSTLICVSYGGATVQASIGGTNFTKRTTSLGTQEIACQDITASGGQTSVTITLNGAQNVSGIIYEFAGGALTFSSGSTQGGSSANLDSQNQATAGSLTVTSASLILAAFSISDSSSTTSHKWFGWSPLGKVFLSAFNNNAGTFTFWGQACAADVTSGTYSCTSSRAFGSAYQAACWAYTDTSGVATYANPYPNAIASENSLPGSYYTYWSGATTNANIAGYTDATSYAPGSTVNFKVDSGNVGFNVEISRLGFYGYLAFGARSQAVVAGTPAVQPAPTIDSYGGTVCAWSTTATWAIPSTATPGMYIANFRRTDNSAFVSSTMFVVRSTAPSSRGSQIMVKTSEFSWQAYNAWGSTNDSAATSYTGRNLYGINNDSVISHRAFAVSFDRPYATSSNNSASYYFDSESALVNFLEGNGYDIAYFSTTDIEKDTTIPSKYTIAVVSAHDEYWSTNMRNAYESARDLGTNLMFFGSNLSLWHVRFDSADTNKRKIICYKDSENTAGYDGITKFDPISYTGTWRDSRTTSGGVNNTLRRPESQMTGQWFIGNGPQSIAMTVNASYQNLPIWRNTAVTSLGTDTSQTLYTGSIGYEFDYVFTGDSSTPLNIVLLQSQNITLTNQAADANGATYTGSGAFTFGMSLYRTSSHALVFAAGTWRWATGISRIRLGTVDVNGSIDAVMQQATLNIIKDLGVAPGSIMDTTMNNSGTALVDPGTAGTPAAYGLSTGFTGWGMPAR